MELILDTGERVTFTKDEADQVWAEAVDLAAQSLIDWADVKAAALESLNERSSD